MAQIFQAYLHGAFHDGTRNRIHRTYRFCQKEREWLERLQSMFESLGHKSWLYREGEKRNLYVLETTAKFLAATISPASLAADAEKIAYIRGYFDAEGGVPSHETSRFYIQFCQKNRQELVELRQILEELGIFSGKVHIPSVKVDPDYYRFFISSRSHQTYISLINSWHPRKKSILDNRMKI